MSFDVAVLGAGPAGLAAARAAATAGRSVALVDAGPRPGGQYWRHAAGPAPFPPLPAGVTHLASHRIWSVGPGIVRCLVGERESRPVTVTASQLVIATGAFDRVPPFPGWDLPGVLTAGGAQALLKANGAPAGRRVVVAGTGPLLLPVAVALAAAGARVVGVYEAARLGGWARSPVTLMANPGKLFEGAVYAAQLARHRIPFHPGHAVVAAAGTPLAAVSVARVDRDWRPVPGSSRRVACDALAVGYGFTPQLELALQLGCATHTDADGNAVVTVDDSQRTNVDAVLAAGEVTGVGGWQLAAVEGRIAGLVAAGAAVPAGLRRRRARLRRFAAALQRMYPMRDGWRHWLTDDTVVCRCERVSAGGIRDALALGATDARSVKHLSRAGMGPCQGRMCAHAVATLVGGAAGPPARPLAQPIPLRALAALPPPGGVNGGSKTDL